MLSLGELAKLIGANCDGDKMVSITAVADIKNALPGQISFLTDEKYIDQLRFTKATAIITSSKFKSKIKLLDIDDRSETLNLLLMDNPYLGYAKVAQIFDTTPLQQVGIHPTAVIADDVQLADTVSIGAYVVIDSGCVISKNVSIGAGCHLANNVEIHEDTRLFSGVNIYHNVIIGKRAVIHSGSVIGSDGFGFANDQGDWIKIPQLGTVIIGDDFEAGSNSTIDRGALNNTVIGNNVKLDNLVHIAHNVVIGDGTAMAGTTAVAGGTVIGKGCTFAGRVSIIGHLEICDNVHLTVSTVLTKSISKPGIYSSGDLAQSSSDWKRRTVRMKQLDKLFNQVRNLVKEIKYLKKDRDNKND